MQWCLTGSMPVKKLFYMVIIHDNVFQVWLDDHMQQCLTYDRVAQVYYDDHMEWCVIWSSTMTKLFFKSTMMISCNGVFHLVVLHEKVVQLHNPDHMQWCLR